MHVYVISEPDAPLVKIGKANDCLARLSSLQTGSPHPLVLRAQWTGTVEDERALHDAFAARRIRGEWFDFGDEDPVASVTAALGREPLADQERRPRVRLDRRRRKDRDSRRTEMLRANRPPWAAPDDIASVTGSSEVWWDPIAYPARWPGEREGHWKRRMMPGWEFGPAPTDYGMHPAGFPVYPSGRPLDMPGLHVVDRSCGETCDPDMHMDPKDPYWQAYLRERLNWQQGVWIGVA